MSDDTGTLAMLRGSPKADRLIAHRGPRAIAAIGPRARVDCVRNAPADRGIRSRIPGRRSRDQPIRHDKRRDELLDGEIVHSLAEAKVVVEGWRRHTATRRPHSSSGIDPRGADHGLRGR